MNQETECDAECKIILSLLNIRIKLFCVLFLKRAFFSLIRSDKLNTSQNDLRELGSLKTQPLQSGKGDIPFAVSVKGLEKQEKIRASSKLG